jgi:hypothetical protein
MQSYLPASWYWIVGNRSAPNSVFSAPGGTYVSDTDAGYAAFAAGGSQASPILSDGELADVFAKAGLNALALAAAPTDWGNVPPDDVVAAVMAAGCSLSSAGTPAVNATYELSGQTWQDLRDEAQYIQTFGAFSGGVATLEWSARDAIVTFTTTAEFLAVVRGLGDYATSWKRWCAGGMTGPAPGFGAMGIA